jgi:hypothetical protein
LRLAIMLAVPGAAEVRTVLGLAAAARRQGHTVYVFLSGQGTSSAGALASLAGQGVELGGCAHSLRVLGLPAVEGIAWGNQMDWAETVRDADRVITLG